LVGCILEGIGKGWEGVARGGKGWQGVAKESYVEIETMGVER
jgi:hypothetical protein